MHINTYYSDAFPLHRGMLQGCHLSPFHFTLAIEPPAAAVNQSTSILAFPRGEREDKISLYAYDALLYLGDTTGSLSSPMSIIKTLKTPNPLKHCPPAIGCPATAAYTMCTVD